MTEKRRKVLLIGWDGADWEHIHPLLDEGLLPTLNGLVEQGTIGNLTTLQPVLSPMLWNSVSTGKFADKHGILGFVEPDPGNGGARPFSSVSRRCKAIWNIFSQTGIRSNVINWWASHPAEPINGCIVSNLFNGVKFDPEKGWVITPGTIHPAEKEALYAQLKFFPSELTDEHILPFIPEAAKIDQTKDSRLTSFAKTFAEMVTTHSVATAVMAHEPWDFMAVYYTGIDHFSHGFMQYHPPQMANVSDEDFAIYKDVVKGAYRFHDMMLERLLQLAGEDTTVILCSDHGFQSGAFRPGGTPREPAGPAVWHRQFGILVMKGEGIKQDERIYGASLIDVGPTLLHLFGLPIGEDMDGRPLVEAFESPQPIETIPSWETVDGDGPDGMHTDDSVMSGASSDELLKQFVALGYIDDQGQDKEKQAQSAEIEGKYNLARCLMWQDRHDEAIPLLEDILFQTPWETRFIVQLADAYFRAGYLKQAEALLEAGFDLEQTAVNQAILNYAKVKLALGDAEAGMQALQRAAKRTPRFPNLHVQIGDVFARQRFWEPAAQAYRRALKLHPELALAHSGLSTVYLRMQKNQEAADAALAAVGLVHRLPRAHFNLGVAMARSGELDRAITAFETAARFAPRWPQPHRWLSQIYEQLNRPADADRHRQLRAQLASSQGEQKTMASDRRDQRFDIPPLEPEAVRNERVVAERPSPGDPTGTSGKSFILVSGLPRSGTSLMMQMLVAGGLEAVSDGVREADIDNPKGYLEWESIKQIGEQPELLDDNELNGKVIKAISMLLPKMPRKHSYKVLFMTRPIEEIAESQARMIQRLGTDGAALTAESLHRGLREHRAQTIGLLQKSPQFESLSISYPRLLREPEAVVAEIVGFLERPELDTEKMLAAIDPSLYRVRQRAAASTSEEAKEGE